MQSNRETLLCHYLYDPLDRLTACTPSKEASTQRFYLKDRLATEVQGAVQRSIVQHEDHLLAQQTRQNGIAETAMLATDQRRSVLNVLAAAGPNLLAYTPYGHRPPENGLLSLLGFNGERPDPVTGPYLLGNGYRAFNPVLMRFNSPDSWSPFGKGGVNSYAYCLGDPMNWADATGHSPKFFFRSGKLFSSSNQAIKSGRVTKTNAGNSTIKNRSTPEPSTLNNIRPLSTNVLSFDDIHHKKPRLNIMAHGTAERKNGALTTMIESSPRNLTPDDIYNMALNYGINFKDYSSARLLVCYSANSNANSFATRFSALTNLPVKGYVGTVHYSPSPNPFYKALEEQSSLFHHNGNGSFTFKGQLKIAKKTTSPLTQVNTVVSITYLPHTAPSDHKSNKNKTSTLPNYRPAYRRTFKIDQPMPSN
jgi:RHS repeat-associated protein